MSTEDIKTEPETTEESSSQDVVEVEWEQVSRVYEIREALIQTERYLSNFLLQHEKRKAEILEETSRLQSGLYSAAGVLREEINLNPELTYELKLPQREGEKAYFVRKEE